MPPPSDYGYYDSPAQPVYYPPPEVDTSPPVVVYNPQPTAVERSLAPTGVVGDTPPISSAAQQPAPAQQYSPKNQALGVADVKELVKSGFSEELILSQIRNSHVVYHLMAGEIIDLKESGVSEKVIDYMINTPPAGSSAKDSRFKLTGIMSDPQSGFCAVINNKVVVEKDYVDGANVKKIERGQVTLDLNGRDLTIQL